MGIAANQSNDSKHTEEEAEEQELHWEENCCF